MQSPIGVGADNSFTNSTSNAAAQSAIDSWPLGLDVFKGAANLSSIRVYHDFAWHSVFGHRRRTFPNGYSLTRIVKKSCPDGREPALLLTVRDDGIKSPIDHGVEWVVVVKIRDYLQTSDPDPAHTFFARGAKGPINKISALQNFVYTTEQLDALLASTLDLN